MAKDLLRFLPKRIVNVLRRAERLGEGEYVCSPFPILEGERVIGILPNSLRRLFTIMVMMGREIGEQFNTIVVQTKGANAEEGVVSAMRFADPLLEEYGMAQFTYEALKDLFWLSVREQFPLSLRDDLGIREGCRVVVQQKLPDPRQN